MGKVCELVILQRLSNSVEANNTIPDEQFGFRQHHSTDHQVLRVVEYATEGFNRKQSTGAIFLDVSKAFDKVWHEGLLYKIAHANIPIGLCRLTASFLKQRRFRIKLDQTKSTLRPATAGVPQGSTLSPLLFSLFIHDIPRTRNTELALYADDTAVYSRSTAPWLITRRLQEAAENLEDWFSRWRIGVNAEKSTAMFLSKRLHQPDRGIMIFNQEIPWRDTTKYLGIIIDRKLLWKAHIQARANKTKAALSSLFCLLNRKSKLNSKNKIKIYKAILRPMMTYGCSVWGTAATTHIQQLQTIQNKVLRMSVDAPWFIRNAQLHRDLDIPYINEYIQELAENTFTRADQHHNPLIRAMGNYTPEDARPHKRPRMVLQ